MPLANTSRTSTRYAGVLPQPVGVIEWAKAVNPRTAMPNPTHMQAPPVRDLCREGVRYDGVLLPYAAPETLLADCRVEWFRGFLRVVTDAAIVRDEFGGSHLLTAWQILCGDWQTRRSLRTPWRNAKLLGTLRQALREESAQGMELEPLRVGAGRRAVFAFIAQARARDRVHHGCATF